MTFNKAQTACIDHWAKTEYRLRSDSEDSAVAYFTHFVEVFQGIDDKPDPEPLYYIEFGNNTVGALRSKEYPDDYTLEEATATLEDILKTLDYDHIKNYAREIFVETTFGTTWTIKKLLF